MLHSEGGRQGIMSRFFVHDPDQGYLLPPNVSDVLGSQHLCFFLHRAVEQLDLRQFEQAYGSEGRLAYPPSMMLKVSHRPQRSFGGFYPKASQRLS